MQQLNGFLNLRQKLKGGFFVLITLTLFACSGDNNDKSPTNHDNPTTPIPLVPPTIINSQSDTIKIIIDWPVDSNVDYYELYWSTTSGTGITGTMVTLTTGQQSYTHEFLTDGVTKISSGTTYYYTIIAVKGTEKSTLSSEVTATLKNINTPVPATPQGVTITPQKTSITVSWTNDPSVVNYNVYWSTTSNTGISGTKRIIPTGQSSFVHEFIDAATVPLTPATDYFYVVTAENANAESLTSVQVSSRLLDVIVVSPSPPATITVTPQNSQIQLSWTNDSTVVSYNVYWSTTTGAGTSGTKVVLAAGISNFAHEFLSDNKTRLSNGIDFYYVVTAMDATNESVASSQVTGRLKNKAWMMPLLNSIMGP